MFNEHARCIKNIELEYLGLIKNRRFLMLKV